MSDFSTLVGSSGLLPEQTVNATLKSDKSLGDVHYSYVLAGPSSRDLLLRVTGYSFSTATPWNVICQARQSDNINHGFPDQFCIQVIQTGVDFLLLRIHRVDVPFAGWGQNLRIDILVYE